jgi:arginase
LQNSFILTPYFLDEPRPGLRPVASTDWRVNELELPSGTRQERMATLYHPLRDFVADSVRRGERPVSIGGDCCTSLGFLAGLQRGGLKPTLIWLDAHGDFNTWETTPSGFLGGMPLAMLAGRGEQTIVEGVGLESLPETQIILSDARDLDPGERESLEGSAVRHLSEAEALLHMALPDGPLYLHFDVDIIDPVEAPAVSYLATGGPSTGLLGEIFRRLAQSGRLAAVSVSAWNPELDRDERTADVVMDLVGELVG